MSNIKLIIFDLSGTTVQDDNAVAKSLHQAASEFGLKVELETFQKTIGTNKIHLYQYLIARSLGRPVSFEDFEKYDFPDLYPPARQIFERYTVIMLEYYHQHAAPMSGAEATFEWCKLKGIKVATDTGFHRDVNNAIQERLGWLERGLVDYAADVEHTGGIGRPAPYMVFHIMQQLGIQSVHEVVKVGDTPADLLSGYNAGCKGNIGVLTGANTAETLRNYPHTHILAGVHEIPSLDL